MGNTGRSGSFQRKPGKRMCKGSLRKRHGLQSRETIKNLMDSMKWTAEQAMEAMKVPVKDREQYMAGL